MDAASEAETAASLHTASDAAPTVNSSTYVDPNSAYPHPQSLRSPLGIAPERNSGEDIATQYVTAKAGELRNVAKLKICKILSNFKNFSLRIW